MSLTESEACRVKNSADPEVPALAQFTVRQINPFQLPDFTPAPETARFPLIQATGVGMLVGTCVRVPLPLLMGQTGPDTQSQMP